MTITRFALSFVLAASFICASGCETPYEARASYQWVGSANQAISDDVQSFIRSKQIPQKDILITQYYVDFKTGRTAAEITIENHYSWWGRKDYILYYDKNNVRTKVKTIRYNHFHI